MFRRVVSKLNKTVAFTMAMILLTGTVVASADTIKGEITLGGASLFMDRYYKNRQNEDATAELLVSAVELPDNIAVSTAKDDYVRIRASASTSAAMVGILPKNAMCIVTGTETNRYDEVWAQITSGSVTGWIRTDMLYMNEQAQEKAPGLVSLIATVNATKVNFRSTPDTSSGNNKLVELDKGDELIVIDEAVVNKDCSTSLWVRAYYEDTLGYIAKQYVDLEYRWSEAVSVSSITGVGTLSSKRFNVVMEAMKYIGVLPYVWGGNSLVTGADCSGFVTQVCLKCGVDLRDYNKKGEPNRPTTRTLIVSNKGKDVASIEDAKPGDLIFYGDKTGAVDHVAFYIGKDEKGVPRALHERSTAYGCVVTKANYRTILKIRSFID